MTNSLPNLPAELIDKIEANSHQLTEHVNKALFENMNVDFYIGAQNEDVARTNHDNHVNFMLSLWRGGTQHTLDITVDWVVKAYMNHGMKKAYWYLTIPYWLEAYSSFLNDVEYKTVEIYYYYMLTYIIKYKAD
jgi:hypothetical protein